MHTSTPACEQPSTSCLTLSNCRTKKLPFGHTRVRSNISQISTLDLTLQHQGNKLAFFMQLYQLHTVEKLATRQCLDDHISSIVFSRNLQHLDFSTLDYSSDEMQPHINVLSSLMIGRILRQVYCTLIITFNSDTSTLKF